MLVNTHEHNELYAPGCCPSIWNEKSINSNWFFVFFISDNIPVFFLFLTINLLFALVCRDSKRDSLDNLIDGCMDECAAALVLMSLSFSPKNNHLTAAKLRSPSLISQVSSLFSLMCVPEDWIAVLWSRADRPRFPRAVFTVWTRIRNSDPEWWAFFAWSKGSNVLRN